MLKCGFSLYLRFRDLAGFEENVKNEFRPKFSYHLKKEGEVELIYENKHPRAYGTLVYEWEKREGGNDIQVKMWWVTNKPIEMMKEYPNGSIFCESKLRNMIERHRGEFRTLTFVRVGSGLMHVIFA